MTRKRRGVARVVRPTELGDVVAATIRAVQDETPAEPTTRGVSWQPPCSSDKKNGN